MVKKGEVSGESNRKVLISIYAAAIFLLAVGIVYGIFFHTDSTTTPNKSVKEQFDELEFVTIHRPHLTYFIDVKYMLCFATRKPTYQDLVLFDCPDRLWKEAESDLAGHPVK